MNNELLAYYDAELRFTREMGAEFAKDYPGVAERLLLGEGECKDPHVERLIEAFALIAGRIRHKIDDEFPEITESLLGILYPHYLQPIPSISIAQFTADATQSKNAVYEIPRHSPLFTRPIAEIGAACTFRTCYPVTLWPLEIVSASLLTPGTFPNGVPAERAVAAIRIELRCQAGAKLSGMGLSRLRFHLDGDDPLVHTLYELILNNVFHAVLVDRTRVKHPVNARFGPNCIRAVGFERDEGLLTYSDRSFIGYRLLQEYFSYPRKFLFFDLCGFDKLPLSSFSENIEIILQLSEFDRRERLRAVEQGIKAETFRLGCTPIINLFDKVAEPIRVTHTQTEYRVIPDLHLPNATEVYSVNRVTSSGGYQGQPKEYEPFYSLRHTYDEPQSQAYWYPSRRPSLRKGDEGSEVYLSLVDLDFRPSKPADEALTVHITCTNRDVPSKLQITRQPGELWLEFQPAVKPCFLHRPSKPLRPPVQRGLQWRLISHLALNHLSLCGAGEREDPRTVDALREVLRLYNYASDPGTRKQIDGIVSVKGTQHLAPLTSPQGIVFALGSLVEIEFDENKFAGGGVFLMASVLERFLGLYSAVNSFSQLVARTSQRKGVLRVWKPRAGEQIIL
jgi:type VI secretion system protein ImpG